MSNMGRVTHILLGRMREDMLQVRLLLYKIPPAITERRIALCAGDRPPLQAKVRINGENERVNEPRFAINNQKMINVSLRAKNAPRLIRRITPVIWYVDPWAGTSRALQRELTKFGAATLSTFVRPPSSLETLEVAPLAHHT